MEMGQLLLSTTVPGCGVPTGLSNNNKQISSASGDTILYSIFQTITTPFKLNYENIKKQCCKLN